MIEDLVPQNWSTLNSRSIDLWRDSNSLTRAAVTCSELSPIRALAGLGGRSCSIMELRKGLLLGSEPLLPVLLRSKPVVLVLVGFAIAAFIEGIVSLGLDHRWPP
jgi:hypothetical protein